MLTFRSLKQKDCKALQNIIRENWNYDAFASSKTAKKLANVFLSSCLCNYTFSCVALLNGQPIGLILLNYKHKHKNSFILKCKQYKAILSLLINKEGRTIFHAFKNIHAIDKELIQASKIDYPAELALFAVSSSAQGKGIGKQLFQRAINYLDHENVKQFYLFTDTSCNFGFYEHQGMIRRQEKECIFNMEGQMVKMNFFIYDYTK